MKRQNLSHVYPKTLAFLKQQDELGLSRLMKDFEEQRFSVEDQAAYFPRFLKSKNISQAVLEVAHFEWCLGSVAEDEMGDLKKDRRGLFMSLSFQALQLGKTSAEILGESEGTHAFWKRSSGSFQHRQISWDEKQVIEALSDDVIYSVEGLINFLKSAHRESASWSETINQLLQDEIVIELKS